MIPGKLNPPCYIRLRFGELTDKACLSMESKQAVNIFSLSFYFLIIGCFFYTKKDIYCFYLLLFFLLSVFILQWLSCTHNAYSFRKFRRDFCFVSVLLPICEICSLSNSPFPFPSLHSRLFCNFNLYWVALVSFT